MDELRCDYCRQVFVAGEEFGGCSCCGAPRPAGRPWDLGALMDTPAAILTYPGKLSEQAIKNIERQLSKAFPERKVIILEEGMKLEFGMSPIERMIRSGFLTPNEIREKFKF
jgi:hypothetical protein